MIKYTIEPPYPWQKMDQPYELDIKSETLEYSELTIDRPHLIVENEQNKAVILEKCQQITGLIREINQLNQPPKS